MERNSILTNVRKKIKKEKSGDKMGSGEARARVALKEIGISIPDDWKESGSVSEIQFSSPSFGNSPEGVCVVYGFERGMEEEKITVERKGKFSPEYLYRITLSENKDGDSEMYFSIKDSPEWPLKKEEGHRSIYRRSSIDLGEGDDVGRIRYLFPEFASELPESGNVDVRATLKALSNIDDPRSFPIVFK